MSLKSALRCLPSSSRSIYTTPIRRQPEASSPSESSSSVNVQPPSPQITTGGGFKALQETMASAINPSFQSIPIPGSSTSRGYSYDAIPPKIDPILDLFTNLLMKHGRKAEAQKKVQHVLSTLQTVANSPPLPLLHRAIGLSSPSVRMLSMRKGAKRIETPRALDERQRTRQGIMWILKASERGRKGGALREDRIAREILSVLEGESDVYKWLEERHKHGTANRSNLNTRQR